MKSVPIQLKQGGQHLLILPGYSTAGYEWVIKNTDEKIIAITKTYKKDYSPKLAGKSADEVFRIKGLSKGSVQVIFELKRSWEKSPKEVKKYHVIIE